MKSRLLSQSDETTQNAPASPRDAAHVSAPTRRETDMVKTFDEVDTALSHASNDGAPVTPPNQTAQLSPEVSARPKGRFVAVIILLVCVSSLSYSLWTTFLRDAAYGVVIGQTTEISTPWSGTLSAIYVRSGDPVRQGDVLAVVEDPELEAEVQRYADQLRTARAQLDAQAALLTLAARDRNDAAEEVRAQFFDLRGELLAERARHSGLESKIKRRRELANQRAYSDEEVESLEFLADGLAAKIEHLQQACSALESRLQEAPADTTTAQLKPWLTEIQFAQAEIARLRQKQRRGTIRAPFSGSVVAVEARVGQIIDEQPICELMPADAYEFALYVKQTNIESYSSGQTLEVMIAPNATPIECRVTRIGARLVQPDAHVAGRYRPEERFIAVYLEPTALPSDFTLRLGSTIRQPVRMFSSPH